jgi:hypothetical protein
MEFTSVNSGIIRVEWVSDRLFEREIEQLAFKRLSP